MLIALRESGEYRLKRFYRNLRGGVRRCQKTARCARGTVSGVVRMVRACAICLDMRPGVGAESPFRQRRKGQNQLSDYQETNRRPPEWRWKNAGAAIEAHDG